ncbi:hypothetical protein CHELA40_13767 [Chelatococcus asaccharovorans]|nr:hypothetical protein CHELA40_13767 [Chelatococcus asaccharovorans]
MMFSKWLIANTNTRQIAWAECGDRTPHFCNSLGGTPLLRQDDLRLGSSLRLMAYGPERA